MCVWSGRWGQSGLGGCGGCLTSGGMAALDLRGNGRAEGNKSPNQGPQATDPWWILLVPAETEKMEPEGAPGEGTGQ